MPSPIDPIATPHSRPSSRVLWLAAQWLALSGLLFGCSRSPDGEPQATVVLTVFAAASLRGPFTELGREFEARHQDVKVELNFAGTQELRTQLEHGARADVFASADQRHLAALAREGLVSEPRIFARNEPVLVVSREATTQVTELADLPRAEHVVLGTAEVPIGRYALAILERATAVHGADFRARVEARVSSREHNVKQVLAKVVLGEADAGIVYRSDVVGQQEKVTVITLEPAINVVAEYPIATVAGSSNPTLARQWVEFVLSDDGQRALERAGFTDLRRVASAP